MTPPIIGRGTPSIISRHMPTQEETLAAMELLRHAIAQPVWEDQETTPLSTDPEIQQPGHPPERTYSHDLRAGRR